MTISKQQFLKRVKNRWPEKYHNSDYRGIPEKVDLNKIHTFKCKKHGEYEQRALRHATEPNGCKACGKEKYLGRTIQKLKNKVLGIEYSLLTILEDTYAGTAEPFKFKCSKHGIQESKAGTFLGAKYSPCTKCSKEMQLLEYGERVYKLLRKKFGETGGFEPKYYVGKEHIKLSCPVHGDISGGLGNVLKRKSLCGKCSDNIITKERFIELSREVHGDRYDYSEVEWVNTTTKVKVICKEHGEFKALPYHHYKGGKCPKCAMEDTRLTFEDFLKKAKEVHGNIYKYSDYTKVDAPVTVECSTHGKFTQKAGSHLEGYGCRECSLEGTRDGIGVFIKKARRVHGDTYSYDNAVYVNSKTPLKITCKEHGDFELTPNLHLASRQGCPACNESKGETAVRIHLEKLGVSHIKECKIEGYPYRWDFYLPDYDLFIEFHGQQHYWPVSLFGGKEGHEACVRRDDAKRKAVKFLTASLLEISYNNIKIVDKIINKKLKSLEGRDIPKRKINRNRHIRLSTMAGNSHKENLPNCGNVT